jgi:hypothetical protein
MDRTLIRIGALRICAETPNSMKDFEGNSEETMLALSPRLCMKRAFGNCRHRRWVISNLKLDTYCINIVDTIIERGTETPAMDMH